MLLALVSSMFYLASIVMQFLNIKKARKLPRSWIYASGSMGVLLHGWLAWHLMVIPEGLDLGFFKIASLVALFLGFLLIVSGIKKPLENLVTALFPFSIVCLLAATFVPSSYEPRSDFDAGILCHIVISILAYSLLTISAAHALVLRLQERRLKSHHTSGWFWSLPPLQTMERLLFELLVVGFILLTLAILSGLIFVQDMFAQHLVHKTALTILAWVIYCTLLWGHFKLGWRGKVAARWTLSGFGVLFLAFIGSRFVLELVLGRV